MVFCMCPPSINTNASFLKNHTPQDLTPIESIYGVLMVDLYGSTNSEECKKSDEPSLLRKTKHIVI